ncbi:hypothetical protein V8C86DRAFT_2466398 [Haematococcus lacustris]
MAFLQHTHAVTRALARSSFATAALAMHPVDIDIDKACHEHQRYVELLRALGLHVEELEADEDAPDCVFVEDTALILPCPELSALTSVSSPESLGSARSNLVIITRPGAESRRREVGPVRAALQDLLPSASFHCIQAPGTLDGGDVLFGGPELGLWVGLSHRTNMAAVEQLREQVPYPVHAFHMTAGGALHLKSVATLLDVDTVLVADVPAGRELQQQVLAVPQLATRIKFVAVPDMLASNCLRIGTHVVVQGGLPASEAIVARECSARGLKMHTLSSAELAKADAALTCCSLLFTR